MALQLPHQTFGERENNVMDSDIDQTNARHRVHSATSEASTIHPATPYLDAQTYHEEDRSITSRQLDQDTDAPHGQGHAGHRRPPVLTIATNDQSLASRRTSSLLSPTSIFGESSMINTAHSSDEPTTPAIFANFAESSFNPSEPFQRETQYSHAAPQKSMFLASRSKPLQAASLTVRGTNIRSAKSSEALVRHVQTDGVRDEDIFDRVRALHNFDPASLAMQSRQESVDSCLAFEAGAIITVFNKDPSGWWDGEIKGRRGWFPSNYVVPYQPKPIHSPVGDKENVAPYSAQTLRRPVMMARTLTTPYPATGGGTVAMDKRSLSSCGSRDEASPSEDGMLLAALVSALDGLFVNANQKRVSQYQPCSARIISAIRAILAANHCLSRESSILKLHSELLRERKSILTELSTLVAHAKKASSSIGTDADTQAMLATGSLVLADVEQFLAVVQASGVRSPVTVPGVDALAKGYGSGREPLTSLNACGRQSPLESSISSRRESISTEGRRLSNSSYATTEPDNASISMSRCVSNSSATSQASRDSHDSADAQTQVTRLYDHLLSTIAAFIGHVHNHTRSSHPSSFAFLIDLTRAAVDEIRSLLHIVTTVARHEKLKSLSGKKQHLEKLSLAREQLYTSTTALVTTASEATSTASLDPRITISEAEERELLLAAATQVLRAAGECMYAVKSCLQLSPHESLLVLVPPSTHRHSGSLSGRDRLHKIPAVPQPEDERNVLQPSFTELSDIQETVTATEPTIQISSITEEQGMRTSSSVLSVLSEQTVTALPSPAIQSNLIELTSVPALPVEGELDQFVSEPATPTSSRASDFARFSTDSIHSAHYTSHTSASAHSSLKSSREAKSAIASQLASSDATFGYEYNDQDITFNSDGAVTGGTLSALVERLTIHDQSIDPAFANAFFLTFRLFTTPTDLTQALINRHMVSMPASLPSESLETWKTKKLTPLRLRVCNAFKTWLELYWQRGTDEEVLDTIAEFAQHTVSDFMPQAAIRLLELVQRRRESGEALADPALVSLNQGQSSAAAKARTKKASLSIRNFNNEAFSMATLAAAVNTPTPVISKTLFSNLRTKQLTDISLLEFDPLELARQFTLMESILYCAIRPEHLIGKVSQKSSRLGETPVKQMSAFSTKITGWVAESILGEKDTGRRQKLVKQFIKVADRCLELNNYNTLTSLLCGLQSSTVSRLQRTWSGLSKKTHETYARLLKAISHNKNYAQYRARLRQSVPPCLPFVGLYLTDLTFVDAGNPALRSRASSISSNAYSTDHDDAYDGTASTPPSSKERKETETAQLINFDKYMKTAKIVLELQRFQVNYPLMPLPEVQAWIDYALDNVAHGGDVNKLYRQSLLLEPRAEMHANILNRSGNTSAALPWQLGLADPMPTPREEKGERGLGGFSDFLLGRKADA